MKTLTWPTTERRRRRRRQNSMPWLITLIFLIRPSIIQSQGMAMPGPLPPTPWVKRTRNHVRVRLWLRVRVWVLFGALNLCTQVLSELWGTVRFLVSVSVSLSALHFEWPPLGHLGQQNCLSYIKIKLSIQILNSLGNRRWNFMAR